MKNKVFLLEYWKDSIVINGKNQDGKDAHKNIQEQIKEILEENDNYTFDSLIEHQDKCINLNRATLIVKVDK